MPAHRVWMSDADLPARAHAGAVLAVTGEEAHHAVRVKRLEVGEAVELLDGRGTVVGARVRGARKERGEWVLEVGVESSRVEPPVSPRLEVLSAVPKGPRAADVVDQLAQAGAASWGPLRTRRGRGEERETRLERLERAASEASKQCGRAWVMEIAPEREFAAAILAGGAEGRVVVADASGEPYRASGAGRVRLLVGPEGGWTAEEVEAARGAGCVVARFGPHVMRVETAAVVAAGVILDAERRAAPTMGQEGSS